MIKYDLDETVHGLIKKVTGGSTQDLMIGSEICVAVGLATRQFSLRGDRVVMEVRATADLRSRLNELGEKVGGIAGSLTEHFAEALNE
jgi:hypothetical protein